MALALRLASASLGLLIALGCAPGGTPRATTITVVNGSASDATAAWQSGGWFGTSLFAKSGTDVIGRCHIYVTSFPDGKTVVTVSSAGSSIVVTLDGTDAVPQEKAVSIDSAGDMIEISPTALPSRAC
jgi:hypothetical protein